MARGLCTLKTAIIWFKRATGIGYVEFPPLDINPQAAKELKINSDDLVLQMEQLERDLRRRGQLPHRGNY